MVVYRNHIINCREIPDRIEVEATISKKLVINGHNTSKIVAIDIEKTRPGRGNYPRAFTIEIGMVKLGLCERDWGKVLSIQDHFSTLVRPPILIKNTQDHNITDAQVVNAPTLKSIADQVLAFLEGAHMVVSHNCSAEYRLFEEMAALGHGSRIGFVDTKEMAKVLDKHCFSKKPKTLALSTLTERFRCSPAEPHRALDDAIACANLYAILRFLLRRFGYCAWDGFKELEDNVKNFTYIREFKANKSAKQIDVQPHELKCRVPPHELAILKKLYWANLGQ